MLNTAQIKKDFPIYKKQEKDKPLIYLDSTATSLKPKSVIEAINGYYSAYSANVFRGIYQMSEKATAQYQKAREKVAAFIGSKDSAEVIFTRNASESLNIIYYSWARKNIGKNDEIVTTVMEHHSNFVPWQQIAGETGCKLKLWRINDDFLFDYAKLDNLITRKTKLLTISSSSNVIGTNVDIEKVVKIAKRINPNTVIVVDSAQSVPHVEVDVKKWGADFVVFSGHKMLGPTGIGVLWGKKDLLEDMQPFLFGGDMISEVHEDNTIFNLLPHKFEAGTPNIAGAIGLGAAVDYLSSIGMKNVRNHELDITKYALEVLNSHKYIKTYGPKDENIRGGVVSFTVKGVHPHDVAQILDEDNICIRVGFHCAQPLHEYIGCGPTARASFYVYNEKFDVDKLIEGLEKVKKIFA
ncbi:SufS family cysteine desulfurase [Patescibacteria group bacterium]